MSIKFLLLPATRSLVACGAHPAALTIDFS